MHACKEWVEDASGTMWAEMTAEPAETAAEPAETAAEPAVAVESVE